VTKQRLTRILLRWTTELVVVFVGVYAAFALAEWKENRDRRERAAQVRAALIGEIRDVQSNTYRVAVWVPDYFAQLEGALSAGTPVAPNPWLEPVAFEPHVWDAVLTSDALDLFDVESFFEVSEFYNLLAAGFGQIAQLRSLSESQLLPRLGEPASTYFRPAADPPALRFKPEYEWYLAGMARLGTLARCITIQGDSALVQLGAVPDTAHSGLSAEGC
jgi:hypothetical protein